MYHGGAHVSKKVHDSIVTVGRKPRSSEEAIVRIWSFSGKVQGEFTINQPNPIRICSVSPSTFSIISDKQPYLTFLSNRGVRFVPQKAIQYPTDGFSSLHYCPYSKLIYLGGSDHTIKAVRFGEFNQLQKEQHFSSFNIQSSQTHVHPSMKAIVGIHSFSTRSFCSATSGVVSIWDISSNEFKEIHHIPVPKTPQYTEGILDLTYCAPSKMLVLGMGGCIRFVTMDGKFQMYSVQQLWRDVCSVHSVGQFVFSGNEKGDLCVYDYRNFSNHIYRFTSLGCIRDIRSIRSHDHEGETIFGYTSEDKVQLMSIQGGIVKEIRSLTVAEMDVDEFDYYYEDEIDGKKKNKKKKKKKKRRKKKKNDLDGESFDDLGKRDQEPIRSMCRLEIGPDLETFRESLLAPRVKYRRTLQKFHNMEKLEEDLDCLEKVVGKVKLKMIEDGVMTGSHSEMENLPPSILKDFSEVGRDIQGFNNTMKFYTDPETNKKCLVVVKMKKGNKEQGGGSSSSSVVKPPTQKFGEIYISVGRGIGRTRRMVKVYEGGINDRFEKHGVGKEIDHTTGNVKFTAVYVNGNRREITSRNTTSLASTVSGIRKNTKNRNTISLTSSTILGIPKNMGKKPISLGADVGHPSSSSSKKKKSSSLDKKEKKKKKMKNRKSKRMTIVGSLRPVVLMTKKKKKKDRRKSYDSGRKIKDDEEEEGEGEEEEGEIDVLTTDQKKQLKEIDKMENIVKNWSLKDIKKKFLKYWKEFEGNEGRIRKMEKYIYPLKTKTDRIRKITNEMKETIEFFKKTYRRDKTNPRLILQGDFSTGELEGRGVIFEEDKDTKLMKKIFEGEFQVSQKWGKGKELDRTSGLVIYEGGFEGNERSGFGELFDQKTGRRIYQGMFQNNGEYGFGVKYSYDEKDQDMVVEKIGRWYGETLMHDPYSSIETKRQDLFKYLRILSRDRKIGYGIESLVYRVPGKEERFDNALKIMDTKRAKTPQEREKMGEMMINMLKIVSSLQPQHHPNIIQFHGWCDHPNLLGYSMTLLDCTVQKWIEEDLFPFSSSSSYKEDVSTLLMKDVEEVVKNTVLGMECVHHNMIMHRGLSWNKVLLYRNVKDVKIAGFEKCCVDESPFRKDFVMKDSPLSSDSIIPLENLIRPSKDNFHRMFGYFVAPEIWAGEGYTKKVDIFSFGMMLYQIFYHLKCPYEFKDNVILEMCIDEKVVRNVTDEEFVKLIVMNGGRPVLFEDRPWVKDWMKDLIRICWHQDPSKRPTFSVIKQTIVSKF